LIELILNYPALGYILTDIGEEEYTMKHYLNTLKNLSENSRILNYVNLDAIDLKTKKKHSDKRKMKTDGFIGITGIGFVEQLNKIVSEKERNGWYAIKEPALVFNHNEWQKHDYHGSFSRLRMKMVSYSKMIGKIIKYIDDASSESGMRKKKSRASHRHVLREIIVALYESENFTFADSRDHKWMKWAEANEKDELDYFRFYAHPISDQPLAVKVDRTVKDINDVFSNLGKPTVGKSIPTILEIIHELIGVPTPLVGILTGVNEHRIFTFEEDRKGNIPDNAFTLEEARRNLSKKDDEIQDYIQMIDHYIVSNNK